MLTGAGMTGKKQVHCDRNNKEEKEEYFFSSFQRYAGIHRGRLAGIWVDDQLDLQNSTGKITVPWHRFTLLQ